MDQLCIHGYLRVYHTKMHVCEFNETRGIPHRRSNKLIRPLSNGVCNRFRFECVCVINSLIFGKFISYIKLCVC